MKALIKFASMFEQLIANGTCECPIDGAYFDEHGSLCLDISSLSDINKLLRGEMREYREFHDRYDDKINKMKQKMNKLWDAGDLEEWDHLNDELDEPNNEVHSSVGYSDGYWSSILIEPFRMKLNDDDPDWIITIVDSYID